jgi:hypothetical protein
MNNVRKSAAVLAGVLAVVAWSVWAKPQQTSSQPAPSANRENTCDSQRPDLWSNHVCKGGYSARNREDGLLHDT